MNQAKSSTLRKVLKVTGIGCLTVVLLACGVAFWLYREVDHLVDRIVADWHRKPIPPEQEPENIRLREIGLKKLRETRACEHCTMWGVHLAGADLRNTRLADTLLRGDMRDVNFQGADLTSAYLGGNLKGADFRGAKTGDLDLGEAQLQGARFDGLDLRTLHTHESVDYDGAVLRGVNFEGVSFVGMYGRLNSRKPTHFFDVPAGSASLRGADLRDANLRDTSLGGCDLRDADLRGADLTGARLSRPRVAADLRGARLGGATWYDGSKCADQSIGECIRIPKPE